MFIAHDLSIVRFISDRIGVIYKGDIVEIADAEELFDFPLHPYTRSLISAIPIPDPKLEKNKILFTYDPSIHEQYAEHYVEQEDGSLKLVELPQETSENTETVETAEAKDTAVSEKAEVTDGADASKPSEEIPTDLVAGGSGVNPPESVEQNADAESESVKVAADTKKTEKTKAVEPKIIKEKPTLQDIGHNHFVFGYKKEIEEYKRIRESGEHVKSITIIDPTTEEGKKAKQQELERAKEREKKLESKSGGR